MANVRKLLSMGLAAFLLLSLTSMALAQVTPSVTISDQSIGDGMVVVDQVVSDGPGWIVIHADENGAPGPVIGQTAVMDGENNNVEVEIDTAMATATMYAMLHTDAGTEGTYEFPGDDTPVEVDGEVVLQAFTVTDMEMEETEETEEGMPILIVSDQAVEQGVVTVENVTSVGPGWVVVYNDENGEPGEVIGYTSVDDGLTENVEVELDADMVTDTIYVRLHNDLGEEGTFEYPGVDEPAMMEGNVEQIELTVLGLEEEPEQLPAAGGLRWTWTMGLALMALGAMVLAGGVFLRLSRR